jgi:cytochrome c-type biogenesis protein
VSPALTFALGAGMVATFNPCGFAMLPAYVSFFLGLDDDTTGRRDGQASVLRALAVGATMTLGFMAVFGVLGLALDPVLDTVQEHLPWVTIVLGAVMVVLGAVMLRGRTLTVNLPKMSRGTGSRELSSVFLFGISYAVVSLSCTLPLFIVAVSTTVDTDNLAAGLGAFVAYGAGMGLVLMVLTLAIALARQGLVHRFRAVLPHVNRVSGALLVVAGAYVAYYGWYELQVREGNTDPGGPAPWVFDLSGNLANWVNDVGPTRLALLLALVIVASTTVALIVRSVHEARADRGGASEAGDRPAVGSSGTATGP